MANLEDKFTELQALLVSQHADLITALGAQQSSLDTIAINSGLQLAALGLIKLDSANLSRLEAIETSAYNLTRLDTIQDDILRLRKAMATSSQYLLVDSPDETLLGRLYEAERNINAIKRIIATDDTYDGLEGNSSRLYGFSKALRDELVDVFSNPDDSLNGVGLSLGDLLYSTLIASQGIVVQAVQTVGALELHTPLLQTIADCACNDTPPPGGDGMCENPDVQTLTATEGQVHEIRPNQYNLARDLGDFYTFSFATDSFDTGNYTYSSVGGFFLIPILSRPFKVEVLPSTTGGSARIVLLTPSGAEAPRQLLQGESFVFTEFDYDVATYPVCYIKSNREASADAAEVVNISFCEVG